MLITIINTLLITMQNVSFILIHLNRKILFKLFKIFKHFKIKYYIILFKILFKNK